MKKFIIDFKFQKVAEIVEKIISFINKNKCQEFEADVSPLNLIDATRTVLMCSTYHFKKYPQGKIYWQLRDKQTIGLIAPLRLSNMELKVKEEEKKILRLVK
ncbi:hypothetical protein IKA92_05445 [bacterium]|nr:hypothetical protein [bacterium]